MTESREEPERWHLKKEVQITHIIMTLTVVAGVYTFLGKIEQRIAILEDRQIAQREKESTASRTQEQTLLRFQQQLDRIEARQIEMLSANTRERKTQ